MENSSPTTEGATSTPQNTNWGLLILGAICLYLLMRKPKQKVVEPPKSNKIDSYSKFLMTPMGKDVEEQLKDEGISLSADQIMSLDKCLQGLKEDEYALLEKACQFVKKDELYRALTKEELKKFYPIRKRIMDCVDETLHR